MVKTIVAIDKQPTDQKKELEALNRYIKEGKIKAHEIIYLNCETEQK